MIGPALCVTYFSHFHMLSIFTAYNDSLSNANFVARGHTLSFVAFRYTEDTVGDKKVMGYASVQYKVTIAIVVSDSIPPKDCLPCLMVCAYSDIKFTQNYKLILFQHIDYKGLQVFIKFFFDLIRIHHAEEYTLMMVAWCFPTGGILS